MADDKVKTDVRPSTKTRGPLDTKSAISKAELRDSSTLGAPGFQGFGTQAESIKGSITATISNDGMITDAQVMTFVSGSNIRLDTNEAKNIIQISVDDFHLWELVDVDDGVSGATNGDILQYDASSTTWKAVAVAEGPSGATGPMPESNDTEIFFNDNGGASASPNLIWNGNAPTTLGVTGNVELDAGFVLGGTASFEDNIVDQPVLNDYSEAVHAVGQINSSTAFNLENGNVQTVTVGGIDTGSTITFSFSNPPASGKAGSITLIMTNGLAHGSVAWHSSVQWTGGSAPTLSTSGTDILSFTTLDGGTTWYGFVGGIGFA